MSKGLAQDEYNALLHAIWRLERLIDKCNKDEQEYINWLRRDKDALSKLFERTA